MGYQVPDPNSARVMKSNADTYNELKASKRLENCLKNIKDCSEWGMYHTSYQGLSKEDIKMLRNLGYTVHKSFFTDDFYDIKWK